MNGREEDRDAVVPGAPVVRVVLVVREARVVQEAQGRGVADSAAEVAVAVPAAASAETRKEPG